MNLLACARYLIIWISIQISAVNDNNGIENCFLNRIELIQCVYFTKITTMKCNKCGGEAK